MFARPKPIPPQPGQESVWDYPRPAILQATPKHLKVVLNGEVIAQTRRGMRVLETSHPPVYYFPADDVRLEYLTETSRKTFCEWKGWSAYYDVQVGDRVVPQGAWRFIEPSPNFSEIQNAYAFYARDMDACYVDDELVTPQPGPYYGGWITQDIVGPFKGEPGTMGWSVERGKRI